VPIVLYHHERFDGAGYPHALAGSSIPELARLLAVADVYDALVSSRPYRPGWELELALDTIRSSAGTHFDPMMVELFFAVMESEGDGARFALGSLVNA
jgi:putative two-component system response regulator